MIVMQGRAHMTRPRSSSSCTNMLLGTLGSRTSTPDGIIQIDVLRGGARTRQGQLPPMDVPPAAVRAIRVHAILRQTDTDSQCRHCSQQQQLPRQMCDVLVHTRRRTPEAMKLHTALATITARISSLTCIRCMSPVASIPPVSSRRRRRRKPERIRYPASVQSVNHPRLPTTLLLTSCTSSPEKHECR